MGNPPVHPLVVHLVDETKLHGIACNHDRWRRAPQVTTDPSKVTCRTCRGQLPEPALIDGSPS